MHRCWGVHAYKNIAGKVEVVDVQIANLAGLLETQE